MEKHYNFNISLSVLNHLGRNLYRNFITVIGEAISNSWDADANNVYILIDKESGTFSIKDDGIGMTPEDFQNKFLKIGYSKRKFGKYKTPSNRPYIGAKGIGKLALLSCADRISIFTKTINTNYTGGTIDNSGLDEAIKDDLMPQEYPLEQADNNLIDTLKNNHSSGTIIIFEGARAVMRNRPDYIRKLLALSFKFSLLDDKFNIYVNGDLVGAEDLSELSETTEFLWKTEEYSDALTSKMNRIYSRNTIETSINMSGYIATVAKPKNLKITGTDERASLDLFVNGRLREKNILKHFPTQRIVESYLYGQINFDDLDSGDNDPFTSSREGILEGDEKFIAMIDELRRNILPKIIDDWDRLRLERNKDGDEENASIPIKIRKSKSLFNVVKDEYTPDDEYLSKDMVNNWIKYLEPDATFNISSYVDCFLSENLIRKYIETQGLGIEDTFVNKAKKFMATEQNKLEKSNISFDIRTIDNTTSYLGMDDLANIADKASKGKEVRSLVRDAVSYVPIRNVVGHTGRLTEEAKTHLTLTYQNIQSRIKKLLQTATD